MPATKNNKLGVLLPLLLMAGLVLVVVSAIYLEAEASVENEVANAVENIQKQMEQEILQHPTLAASSNPYDYEDGLSGVDAMVRLGHSAIPYIEQAIYESEGSGLTDYMFAIAIEQIAKVDLKSNPGTSWETGDSFLRQWNRLLAQTPRTVLDIASSNLTANEKIQSLEKLGLPAIPFIIDQVKDGNRELFPAILSILSEDDTVVTYRFGDEMKWVQANEDRFDGLKSYVLSKKEE